MLGYKIKPYKIKKKLTQTYKIALSIEIINKIETIAYDTKVIYYKKSFGQQIVDNLCPLIIILCLLLQTKTLSVNVLMSKCQLPNGYLCLY